MKLQQAPDPVHLVTRLDEADDTSHSTHGVLLARPAGPEPPGGNPDSAGVEPLHDARAVGGHELDLRRPGERSIGVTSLGHDHGPVALERRAVAERNLGIGPDSRQLEHLSREASVISTRSGVVLAREHLDRLGDLEGVADGATEGSVHRAQHAPSP